MIGEKNHDHVAVHPDQGVMFWEFVLPSDVETCEEQANEMASRCKTLFTTFRDFLIPTEINYYVHRFPSGQKLSVGLSDNEHVEAIGRELLDESGITVEEVLDSMRVSGSGSRWIPRVGFDGTKVKVKLDDGDVFASRSSRTIEYRAGESIDNRPSRDLLELTLLHTPNTAYPDINAEFVTTVMVSPFSDIWFEDTAIGSANRRYLSSFLERIEDVFPVEDVERTSDWLALSALHDIY